MTGDPRPTHRSPECPGPELLAAHVEGRLPGREAARVDAHVATCATCYEVFSETVRFALAEGDGDLVVAPTRRRVPTFVRLVGLAAAALVLLALPLSVWWRASRGVAPLVTELAQALGPRRLVEPRLSAGFEYARLETLRSGDAPRGLDAQPPEVLAAVARIRERARDDPSPEALGALALTYLVAGDASAAVDALEDATAQSPGDPRLLSDLAAAYLARAAQLDEPADVPAGLEAAERAVALAHAPDAAWFNRALALERLSLDDAAREAWRDYLARDAGSGWADEARRHLADLEDRQSSARPTLEEVRAALERDEGAAAALAADAPERLRTYLEDVLLPEWSEAYLAGSTDAERLRERVLAVGDALTLATGDAEPRDAARALLGAGAGVRAQALGYRRLREAAALYDLQRPSCSAYRQAERDLASGGSPYALQAQLQEIVNCGTLADAASALKALAPLGARAASRGYVEAQGRVAWLQGLVQIRQGDLTASLERYGAALDIFRAIHDVTGEAAMHAALAEVRLYLGAPLDAWSERRAALALLASVDSLRRRHAILSEALLATLEAGMTRTARHFCTALVDTVSGWDNAIAVAAALTRRAAILDALGDEALAAADIRAARERLDGLAEDPLREHVLAQLDVVEGTTILASHGSPVAAEPLERALAYAHRTAPSLVPGLQLLLSRAEIARGLEGEAEAHLLDGIQALESGRLSMRDAALQISFFDRAFPLFEDMVRLQVARRRPEQALAFVERGHARQLVDAMAGGATSPLDAAALQRELPPGVALVYYMPQEDQLYAWTLTHEEIEFIERPLPAGELSRLVAAHRTAIERRASPGVVEKTAARLHDELVRPLIPYLAGQRALVFVADGPLQGLPFASLWNREDGRYLVEDYVLGVAPSGSVFVRASAEAAALHDPRALVVGDPRIDATLWRGLRRLPGAEAEAREVSQLYGHADSLTGAAATRLAFLEGVPGHAVVHFAGHALAPRRDPGGARLLFSPDPASGDTGALALEDSQRAAFSQTQVVVLAACRTAAGPVSHVEGALSLGRPLLAVGVPNVVGSLWDVDDGVSRRFFVAFHGALLEDGRPERALRATQLALIRDGDAALAHPASWAPFVSIGGFGPFISSSSSPDSSPHSSSSSSRSFAKGESS